jgi:hypothetical protein
MALPLDRNQLVTIAVTAAISVTFREVLTWLASLAKISALRTTTKEKVKKIFNKNNRAIIWAVVCLVFNIVFFIDAYRETTPLTRSEVVKIVIFFLGIVFWVVTLLIYLAASRLANALKPPPP